jgi:hypothetical protein
LFPLTIILADRMNHHAREVHLASCASFDISGRRGRAFPYQGSGARERALGVDKRVPLRAVGRMEALARHENLPQGRQQNAEVEPRSLTGHSSVIVSIA